jgi:hypothetical protein
LSTFSDLNFFTSLKLSKQFFQYFFFKNEKKYSKKRKRKKLDFSLFACLLSQKMKAKKMKKRREQKKQSAKESFHFLRFFFQKLCFTQFLKKNWKNFFKSKYKRIFPKLHILHFLKHYTSRKFVF